MLNVTIHIKTFISLNRYNAVDEINMTTVLFMNPKDLVLSSIR